MSEARPDGRFQPGVSGNPAGRPKGSVGKTGLLKTELRRQLEAAGGANLQAMVANLIFLASTPQPKAVDAARLIFEYVEGKAPTIADLGDGGQGGAVVLVLPANGRELPDIGDDELLSVEDVVGAPRTALVIPAPGSQNGYHDVSEGNEEQE